MNAPARNQSSRWARLIATTAALLLAVTACSSNGDGGSDGSDSADGSGADGNSDFSPVTIEHALGEAEITEKPERVVTLGQGSTETAIALGVTPVGMENYTWGADETGYLPWVHEAVQERGDELPELIGGGTELDIEGVLEMEPDVILAPWSGITQEQYDLLSDIAPTVAYEEEPWETAWDDQIEVIAESLGKPDQAEELISTINTQFEEAQREEYADYTFSYIYNDGPGTLGVFFPGEQRVAMLNKLGLTVDPAVENMDEFEVPGTDSAMIGLENADMLNDSDLIFTFYADAANREEIESQDLYSSIPAIEQGAVVASEDQPFVTASSMINPLTVPWVLERYEPMINEAIENVDDVEE